MTKENIEGKTKFYYLMQTFLLILATLGLVSTCCILFSFKTDALVNEIMDVIIYVLIIYYYLVGYRKAHSNLLKYIFLFYAIFSAYNGLYYNSINKAQSYSLIVSALLLAFIAGRLNKFNKNRWILLFCFVLLTVATIYSINHLDQELLSVFTPLEQTMYKWGHLNAILQFTTLSLAYLTRCYKHQKIGIDVDEEKTI